MGFSSESGACRGAKVTEREAALALLRIRADLRQAFRQTPRTAEERYAWSSGISGLLIEVARGRLYLSRLREALVGDEASSVLSG